MKTLVNSALFAIFNGLTIQDAKLDDVSGLRIAYDEFIELVVGLSEREDDLFLHLRRLNYTRIELTTLIHIVYLTVSNEYNRKTVLVFLQKTVAFIDNELRLVRMKIHGTGSGSPASPLRWGGTQRDLVELCTALSENGTVKTPRNLPARFSEILRGMEGLFAFKVREPHVIRTQLFERSNDPAPFLFSLQSAYLRLADEKLK